MQWAIWQLATQSILVPCAPLLYISQSVRDLRKMHALHMLFAMPLDDSKELMVHEV
jgi:hypothetical protein